jgi:hypothetical protein
MYTYTCGLINNLDKKPESTYTFLESFLVVTSIGDCQRERESGDKRKVWAETA